jgi:potassium voltage-gated channel Eag-related subfamily H protein 8
VEEDFNILDHLVIKIDSNWKSYFDLLMLFASVYNSFTQAYYSAFGEPHELFSNSSLFMVNFLDYSIEVLFIMDFIFCFCQEYKDLETYLTVSDLKKIAKNYMKGSCIFDFLANIPFELLLYKPATG